MSHPLSTALLAMLLAAASALPGNRSGRDRLHHAIYILASSVVTVAAGGWIMHWIHG